MVAAKFPIPSEALAAYCHKWKITEFALFGSVLREDFGPDSDVDCMVTFRSDAEWTLLDFIAAEEELGVLFQRPVDLVERCAIEKSENKIRRERVLKSAKTIYAG